MSKRIAVATNIATKLTGSFKQELSVTGLTLIGTSVERGVHEYELRAKFPVNQFRVEEAGHFAGNNGFMADLRAGLAAAGFTASGLRGMTYNAGDLQGERYASFSVTPKFAEEFVEVYEKALKRRRKELDKMALARAERGEDEASAEE